MKRNSASSTIPSLEYFSFRCRNTVALQLRLPSLSNFLAFDVVTPLHSQSDKSHCPKNYRGSAAEERIFCKETQLRSTVPSRIFELSLWEHSCTPQPGRQTTLSEIYRGSAVEERIFCGTPMSENFSRFRRGRKHFLEGLPIFLRRAK